MTGPFKPPMPRTDTPDAPAPAPPSTRGWLWPIVVLLLMASAVVAECLRSPEDMPWLVGGLGLGVVLVAGLATVLAGARWSRHLMSAFAFVLLAAGAAAVAIALAGAEHANRILRLAGVIGIVCVAFPGNPAVRAPTLRLGVALLLLALMAAGDLLAARGFLQVGLGLVAVLAMVALRAVLRDPADAAEPATAPAAPSPVVAAVAAAAPDLPPAGEPSYGELKRELARHQELEKLLMAAKQEAEAATMAKGEFLATMSHEIRTPLNGIIPLLDILLSTKLAPDQRDYLVTAYQSAKQLLSIVDDILDYSKIEANKLELETVGLNIKDIVESVTRLMTKSAEGKGLRLVAQIDPNVRLAMRGDPTRLRQVLTNLVSNAIKFTERGSVTIDVRKRGESRASTDLLFSVTDTGVGIAPDAQSKLFKPFVQADTSTTRMHGGTGLGLVICRRIVELMGGEIGVRSEVGKGSSFWFSVPLLKAVGDVAPTRTDIRGSRALIVTTDQALIRRLSGFFGTCGMQFLHTSVSAEALAKLRSAANMGDTWAYDFLVLDWGAMKNTALSLARNVLREQALERVRVVAISGDDEIPGEVRGSSRIAVFGRQAGDVELRTGMQRLLEAQAGADGAATPVVAAESLLPELQAAPEPIPGAVTVAPLPTPVVEPSAAAALGGHVLLVEDNAVNRQVAQRLLSLVGVSFEIAENGRQAVDRLEGGQFDAVLMDCMMPILDGYGATRAIRKLESEGRRHGRIPIIAMTANAMAGDREKCLQAGMDDYMSKPLNRALLEQTLRKWIGSGTRARAAAAIAGHAAATAAAPAVSASTAASPAPANRAPAAPAAGAPARPAPRPSSPIGPAPEPGGLPPQPSIPRPEPRPEPRPAAPPAAAPAMGQRAAAAYVAPAREGPAINQEIIQDLLEMMGAEFTELVRVYLEDTPKGLAILERAAQLGDLEGLIAPAHSLKSTSANLGASRLSELAKHIEHGARQGRLGGEPVMLVAELGAEFQRVSGELRRLLAGAPG